MSRKEYIFKKKKTVRKIFINQKVKERGNARIAWIDRIIKREARRNETKKPRCGRRNEGRRMPQGRNEEIRKGGIGIGKKKKKEKEEVEKEEERTEDNRGIVYVDIRCKVQERWKEGKGRGESS